jgi:hypothetical protein
MRAYAACLIGVSALLTPGAWAQAPGGRSVLDYGAKADGASDDTPAFQKALDECGAGGGGVVFVPPGHYLIESHLEIPASVTLQGTWRSPATVDAYHAPDDPEGKPLLRGSVLLAVEGAGDEKGHAFIHLGFNSTLEGLTIFYPNQTKTNPPVAYPWTVQSAGADNPAIVDVLMVNPYQAVDFGSVVAGRHYIRNLYAEPLRRGLYVDVCFDVGRLENIHFWPFWTAADQDSPISAFMLEQGEAFIFARSDWELVTNCFAIGYKVGMRFIDGGQQGAGNYLITGGGADMCATAVLVEQTQGHSGASFANCQFFGDIVVAATNNGPVRFAGCGLFGSIDGKRGTALAKLAGPGRVSFDNCHFYCIHPESRNADTMIVAESGRLSIQNCVFINSANTAGVNSNPIPIALGEDVRSAVILGNEFYGEARIVNRSRGRAVIEHNIERTDEEPFPGGGQGG